jgi:hypothetical protein
VRSLDERLDQLPPDLQPLAGAVWEHRSRGTNIRGDGTVEVAPMPWVGPEAFAFVLYPAAEPAWLAAFARRTGRAIPETYAAVLAALNGCFAFDLALYGLPPSLQAPPPLLARGTLEPLDLETANRYWAQEYRGAGQEFCCGGCTLTATENVGYFLTSDGLFRSRHKDGDVRREWASIRDLLIEELPAAEARDQARRRRTVWPWEARQSDA